MLENEHRKGMQERNAGKEYRKGIQVINANRRDQTKNLLGFKRN
jgi:hypothetical protein